MALVAVGNLQAQVAQSPLPPRLLWKTLIPHIAHRCVFAENKASAFIIRGWDRRQWPWIGRWIVGWILYFDVPSVLFTNISCLLGSLSLCLSRLFPVVKTDLMVNIFLSCTCVNRPLRTKSGPNSEEVSLVFVHENIFTWEVDHDRNLKPFLSVMF